MNNPKQVERRFLSAERCPVILVERDDAAPPMIRGHAAVFYDGTPTTEYEYWDIRERIMPTAFDRALKEKDDVRALFNHNPDNLLGRVSAGTLILEKDDVGLLYRITPPDTTVGQDVMVSLSRGDLQGSSFAFLVTDEEERKEDDVWIREITGVELFDVGPVTYPAYEATDAALRSLPEKWRERKPKPTETKMFAALNTIIPAKGATWTVTTTKTLPGLRTCTDSPDTQKKTRGRSVALLRRRLKLNAN